MSWRLDVRLRVGDLRLDVELEGGEKPLALIGPNGSGKTTLLRTIAGAHRPDEGTIRIGDDVVFDSARRVDVPPERRRVGYVPQGYGLFPHLSVLDNVAFGWIARAPRPTRSERRRAAAELLERTGSGRLAERGPGALSGGEQQRVAVARALAAEPALLLLDEPLAALDAPARRAMRRYLAEHVAGMPGPAIVVSHDADDVAAFAADVCVLEEGRVVQRGSAAALAERPATGFVEAFFDRPRARP